MIFEAGPVPPAEGRCSKCGSPVRPQDRYCSTCGNDLSAAAGATVRQRFCDQCGAALEASHRFCTACGFRVTPPGAFPVAAPGSYPVRYDVPYPEKLSRLLIFVKWLLAVPHFLIVIALGYATAAVSVVAFFAILFTRRYPRGLFNLVVGINRWGANVTAYTYLFRDEYPPFSLEAGRYPVEYDVEYPERLSRWWIFVKWLLVIPHQFVLTLLSIAGFFFGFLSWFAILFTGRYPRTFFNFNVGLQRWALRVGAYSQLLRDEFPPYSKRADAKPGSGRAIALSAVFGAIGAVAITALYLFLLFSLSRDTETVDVSYVGALAGRETRAVDLEGTVVVLERALDPFETPYAEAGRGERLVAFELQITNDDSLITFVDETAFQLEDTSGEDHDPRRVLAARLMDDALLSKGEQVRLTVVFKLDSDDDPQSLTYSPAGPITFLPFGEDVRFEFW